MRVRVSGRPRAAFMTAYPAPETLSQDQRERTAHRLETVCLHTRAPRRPGILRSALRRGQAETQSQRHPPARQKPRRRCRQGGRALGCSGAELGFSSLPWRRPSDADLDRGSREIAVQLSLVRARTDRDGCRSAVAADARRARRVLATDSVVFSCFYGSSGRARTSFADGPKRASFARG